jgi:hypothetical protein
MPLREKASLGKCLPGEMPPGENASLGKCLPGKMPPWENASLGNAFRFVLLVLNRVGDGSGSIVDLLIQDDDDMGRQQTTNGTGRR